MTFGRAMREARRPKRKGERIERIMRKRIRFGTVMVMVCSFIGEGKATRGREGCRSPLGSIFSGGYAPACIV
jgi:hypothetical protein